MVEYLYNVAPNDNARYDVPQQRRLVKKKN